jgi:transaldolase
MALAAELQREGTAAFARSWRDLMHRITSKIEVLTQTHPGRVTP